MSEHSLPKLQIKKKQPRQSQNLPPNFTDLRPEARAVQEKQQRRKQTLRAFLKSWYVRVGVVVVVLAAGVLVVVLTSTSSPVPKSIVSAAQFPVLYPKTFPAGYGVDPATMSITSGVLVFVIQAPLKTNLNVSEQAKPGNFDFTQLTGDMQFQTTYGNAILKVNGNQTTASLVASKTWVLINSTGPVATKDMQAILNSFQPVSAN